MTNCLSCFNEVDCDYYCPYCDVNYWHYYWFDAEVYINKKCIRTVIICSDLSIHYAGNYSFLSLREQNEVDIIVNKICKRLEMIKVFG